MESGEKKNTFSDNNVLSNYLEKHYNTKLFTSYFYLLANSKPQKALAELGQLVANHDDEVGVCYIALKGILQRIFQKERINLISRLLSFAPNN